MEEKNGSVLTNRCRLVAAGFRKIFLQQVSRHSLWRGVTREEFWPFWSAPMQVSRPLDSGRRVLFEAGNTGAIARKFRAG
jgi:hypothetical protein